MDSRLFIFQITFLVLNTGHSRIFSVEFPLFVYHTTDKDDMVVANFIRRYKNKQVQ